MIKKISFLLLPLFIVILLFSEDFFQKNNIALNKASSIVLGDFLPQEDNIIYTYENKNSTIGKKDFTVMKYKSKWKFSSKNNLDDFSLRLSMDGNQIILKYHTKEVVILDLTRKQWTINNIPFSNINKNYICSIDSIENNIIFNRTIRQGIDVLCNDTNSSAFIYFRLYNSIGIQFYGIYKHPLTNYHMDLINIK